MVCCYVWAIAGEKPTGLTQTQFRMNRKQFLRAGLVTTAGLSVVPVAANIDLPAPTAAALPAKVVKAGTGAGVNVLGSQITYKLTGSDTYGLLTWVEDYNAPGIGIPLHVHSREDEVFRVLEGEVEFTLGEEKMVLKAGDVAFAPRNVPHAWKVVGDKPARSIMIANPSGIERMFEELGKLAGGPPDFGQVAAICSRYGIEFLPS